MDINEFAERIVNPAMERLKSGLAQKSVVEELEELLNEKDREKAHVLADKVITDLLLQLGFEDVVRAWEKVERWHA